MGKHSEKKFSIPKSIDISEEDIYEAMKEIRGYLDITPGDFKEIYKLTYRHAFNRLARSIKARDIMTKDVSFVTRATPLKEVAKLMAREKISGVPVVDADKKVLGVISEKDFLAHMGTKDAGTFMGVVAECLEGKGCLAVPIRAKKAEDIMTSPAVTVSEDTTFIEIVALFTEKNINRLPVTDNKGCLIGIVSRGDVVQAPLFKDRV